MQDWSLKLASSKLQLDTVRDNKLENSDLKDVKQWIELKPLLSLAEDDEEDCFWVTLPPKMAQLGRQAQPTTTPTKTAIQRGTVNKIRSNNISHILGFFKTSNNNEITAIFQFPPQILINPRFNLIWGWSNRGFLVLGNLRKIRINPKSFLF